MFQKIAKHRANDASNDVHRPPLFKMGDGTRLCALLFALIFPPISVLMVRGCGCDLILNIILTLLAYIPGMIHAFWVTLKSDSADSPA